MMGSAALIVKNKRDFNVLKILVFTVVILIVLMEKDLALKKIKQIIVILNLQVMAVNNVKNKMDGSVQLIHSNHQETRRSITVSLIVRTVRKSLPRTMPATVMSARVTNQANQDAT